MLQTKILKFDRNRTTQCCNTLSTISLLSSPENKTSYTSFESLAEEDELSKIEKGKISEDKQNEIYKENQEIKKQELQQDEEEDDKFFCFIYTFTIVICTIFLTLFLLQ
jgi:hypothetical protein